MNESINQSITAVQFSLILQRYFLLMDCGVLYVYSYDGTVQGTPRISGQRLSSLTSDHVTAAREVLAVVSPGGDGQQIHCHHYRSGKPLYGDGKPLVQHGSRVTRVQLDASSLSTGGDQLLIAFSDSSRDLHLLPLPSALNNANNKWKPSLKLGKKNKNNNATYTNFGQKIIKKSKNNRAKTSLKNRRRQKRRS